MLRLQEGVFTTDVIKKHTTYLDSYTYTLPIALSHYQTLQSQDPLHLLDQPAQKVIVKVAAVS